jgi:predicted acylesterase/phospholipase RssA
LSDLLQSSEQQAPQQSQPAASPSFDLSDSRDGNDAVCFTSGFPGATFGAGAIHAYLAADREPPQVVAGISLGTLSAAVMQRSYQDLQQAKNKLGEAENAAKSGANNAQKGLVVAQENAGLPRARWEFFRKYLAAITNRPFDVIWKGIPDPADFLAELPPIKDPVPETITDPKLRKKWKDAELASRHELYLFVKLGHWLAKSPVRISTIANLLVSYVRSKERYPSAKIVRLLVAMLWQLATVISLILHVVRAPERFPAYKFQAWREQPSIPSGKFHTRIAINWLHPFRYGWLRFFYGVLNLGIALLIPCAIAMWRGWLPVYYPLAFYVLYVLIWFAWGHVFLLALIAAQIEKRRSAEELCPELPNWWFHFRSSMESVIQSPLFGWPAFIFGSLFLIMLGTYAAILAVLSLKYLLSAAWYQAFPAFIASIVCLFFTTSLATWRVPMRGKFPFRVVPLSCSIVAVIFFTLCWHAKSFMAVIVGKNNLNSLDRIWNELHNSLECLSFLHRSRCIQFFSILLEHPFAATVIVLLLAIILYSLASAPDVRDAFIKSLLQRVKMEKHLVHDYHLRYALTSLFSENAESPLLTNKPFPVVLVATPLQSLGTVPTLNNQLWANVSSEAKLVDVLRATMAVPVLLDPLSVEGKDMKIWYKADTALKSLDMVDAAIIRENPLPAFFNFLRREQKIVKSLESKDPSQARVHVVYSVPAQPPGQSEQKKLDNILDVAFLSLRLAQRRDINLEIDQTNFISRLAYTENDLLGKLTAEERENLKKDAPDPIFPVFADHIAPSTDLAFQNPLAPTREEVLKHAAAGCKATLQQLYAPQIRSISSLNSRSEIDCPKFLAMVRRQKNPNFEGNAGLPEICQHCDQHLQASPDSGRKAVFSDEEVLGWRSRQDLDTEFPQLKGDQPRIVFVASGGVFRGPFHAGMINAMLALKIKPDLIVGASVGTLVGAALGATMATDNHQHALDVLSEVVATFQESDNKVAFTKTLKNAARELGIRGRNVDLAPSELRERILKGTKADPGYAVTGTPPILIDAISELLLLPHENTKEIAAEFVAGHFTEATRRLIQGVREETLQRLDIVDAVMGASLLEPTARRLLGSMVGYSMDTRQPYNRAGIALFGTSTNLKHQQPVLLGRYKFRIPSYDFVNACLASSAFPAVFAPRREDQIFPGLGDPDEIYSDGGMFDNLPISPALEILTASQRCWINNSKTDSLNALCMRVENPDLFITGSLDITASENDAIFDNLVSIRKRAGTLQNNVKIKAFEDISCRISSHLTFLCRIASAHRALVDPKLHDYLNGLVNAVLLPVYPTDAKHLNGTFQFCDSMGRDICVVNASMADGCFQTLKEVAVALDPDTTSLCARTVKNLAGKGRIPILEAAAERKLVFERNPDGAGHYCPFFRAQQEGRKKPEKFVCPFSERAGSKPVFQSCVKDPEHEKQHEKLTQIHAASST